MFASLGAEDTARSRAKGNISFNKENANVRSEPKTKHGRDGYTAHQ
jgi:hypothetical protein